MSPHDPSTCPFCRWKAERDGWHQGDDKFYLTEDGSPLQVWFDKDNNSHYAPPSSCTSLDAVAGLWAELAEATDNPEWWALERREGGWGFYKLRCLGSEHAFQHDLTSLEYLSPPNMPGQPIIEAAMQVLGKKEK